MVNNEAPAWRPLDQRASLDWSELHRILDYASTLPEKAEPSKETVTP